MRLANNMALGTLTNFVAFPTKLQVYEYNQGRTVGLLFQGTYKELFDRKDHLLDKLERWKVARIEAGNGVLIIGIKE